MRTMEDLMIDKMNRDREAEMAQKVVKICKHCTYFYNENGCPESKGENDSCEYFSL
jgi:hypothetical protein